MDGNITTKTGIEPHFEVHILILVIKQLTAEFLCTNTASRCTQLCVCLYLYFEVQNIGADNIICSTE